MELYIELSRTVFRVMIPYPVEIEETFRKFLLEKIPVRWDAEIEFIQGCDGIGQWPDTSVSDDEQMIFRTRGDEILCEAKGGCAGPMAYTVCSANLSSLVCHMNTECYPPLRSLGTLLQLVPLKWFLTRKGVLLFHAAQIQAGSKTILFAAPSGTGKTTQSKLWATHRGAQILRNDRVLVRGTKTYGFPYDGAEPVSDPEEREVNAIVCLGQARENSLTRLRPVKAIAKLMNLVLFDSWDTQIYSFVLSELANMISSVPVYQLDCTPDEDAVRCLENQLRKDGVID